jgi:hypothetical protein
MAISGCEGAKQADTYTRSARQKNFAREGTRVMAPSGE